MIDVRVRRSPLVNAVLPPPPRFLMISRSQNIGNLIG